MEEGSNNQSAPVRRGGEDEQSRQDDIQGKSDDKPMSDPSAELGGLKLLTMTVGLCLSLFLVTLDTNIIAIAIPKITDEFHSINDIGWYGSVYLLTACTFQLVFGKLYSLFSTKSLYIAAIILFEVGSVVCAAAPNSIALIIGRAVAGLGCAGILAGTFTIIAIIIPPRRRPAYSGIVGAVYAIASVAGPLLGGVFTDKLTWRWCFWINLPIGAVAVLFTIFCFHSPGVDNKNATFIERVKRIDPVGVPLLIIAVVCLLLALQWGGTVYRWNDPKVFMLIVIFGILSIAFMWLQARQGGNATLPISILTQRSVVGASLFGFASGGTSFMLWQYIPIWFQAIQGVSPVQAGIRSIAMILATAVSSIIAGAGTTATGYTNPFLIASSVLMAVGAGLLTTWSADTPDSRWIGYQVVFGIGSGMCMQTPIMVVQTVLPMVEIPQGTALIMFLQTFGGTIFISVAQNIFINRLEEGLAADFPGVDVGAVVNDGATSIRDQGIFPEGSRGAVLELYNIALTHSWYLAIALASLSLFGSLAVEWRKIKKREKKTEAAKESIQSDGAAWEEVLTGKSAEVAKTA